LTKLFENDIVQKVPHYDEGVESELLKKRTNQKNGGKVMEACFEGMTCRICGSEIEENEDYKWSDKEEGHICMNCADDEYDEDDRDDDDWDDWDDEDEDDRDGDEDDDWDDEDDECECGDECDRCGKTAPCKEVWGENLCPSCYGDTVDGFLK